MSDWPSYGESSRRTRDRPDASKQPAGDVGDGDDTDLFRELRSLQAQAQALNTHNGEDGVPSVKRDFDQLLQGSLAMVRTGLARAGGGEGDDAGGRTSPTHNAGLLRLGDGSGTGAGTGSGQFDDGFVPTELVTKQISSNATQLLAHTSYDNDKVRRGIRSLDLAASSFEPRENVAHDVEAFLSHYHQVMVCTAIDEAKDSTFVQCSKTIETQLEDDWNRTKQLLFNELGLKQSAGQSMAMSVAGHDTSNIHMGGATPHGMRGSRGMSPSPAQHRFAPTPLGVSMGDMSMGGVSMGGVAMGAMTPGAMRSPAPSQGGWTNGGGASVGGTHGPHGVAGGAGAGAGAAARLDHVTTVYAEAVRRMAESRRPGGHVDYSVASAFKEVAKSLTKGATVSSQVLKPWDLIIMMMHESSADASGVLGNADRAENERILAAGAARFLERSSEEHMRNKLNRKRAGVGGELGLLTLVRAWIDQRASSNSSRWASWYRTSTPQVDGMPLWPQVFYCLRCGGRREALELLRAAAKDAALPRTLVAAMEAVTHALSLQVSERGGAADAAPAIAAVNQRFEEVDRASENGTGPVDPFQREVFNLLGYGAPQKQTLSPVVYPFVQDFVWQKLVFVLTGQLGQAAGRQAFTMKHLANMILAHGWALFDPKHQQPYKYFQLLLLCGRFERAINYLAKHASDLAPAVHFALALHHHGVLRTPAEVRLPTGTPGVPLHASSSTSMRSNMNGTHGRHRDANAALHASPNAKLDHFLWLVTPELSKEEQADMDVRLGLAAGMDDTSGAAGGAGVGVGASAGSSQELLAQEYLDLPALVQTYVQDKLKTSPRRAADYICMLLDRDSKNKAVVLDILKEWVLSSDRAMNELVGRLDQLTPLPGHLHHRVTEEFVKNVITKAANEARERGLLWQAAFLYLRIGPDRIKPVLSIVNDRVGAVAAEYSGNTNRRNWVALAQTIHSKLIPRYKALARGNAEHEVETLQTLLTVVQFYDLVNARPPQEHEALAALASTRLLPDGRQQLSPQFLRTMFERLDPVLRKLTQHIIFTALRCLRSIQRGGHDAYEGQTQRQVDAIEAYHSSIRRFNNTTDDIDRQIQALLNQPVA